ncbi:EAL domain-containing protein [Moritella marina ATCC 15381]|uniref:EAL domain-containing protein n=1 Tax=Moritella marina ATCC 15381 TaxID=1202962 RepID=A0A5J6WFB2_MORMI|nr:EAL domain-containing protein [Moritella marina]QFI36526.1 EAL domain-containing protein [Moritella marina ATCC 15381]
MPYIKTLHHNSVIIKNIENDSSAEFNLLAQSIVSPKNRKLFALEITSNFNHHSKNNVNIERFFDSIPDDFLKELMLIKIEALNKNESIINADNIIASIHCPFNLLSDNEFIKKIISLSKVRLAFEINSFIENTLNDNAKYSITLLKDQGHELWLDNFTSEDIPINVLKIIMWDRVKIDKTFMYKHMNNNSIFSALYDFVSNNSLKKLIFKGIESDYQHDRVTKLNCLCQGFLYCKPFNLESIGG